MTILAIDPGLDRVGWAVFRIGRPYPALPADFRRALVDHGSISTSPDDQLPARVAAIHRGLIGVLEGRAIRRVFVEVPRTPHTYHRNEAATTGRGFIAGTMDSCNRAIGAIALSLHVLGLTDIQMIPASPMEKRIKSEWVLRIWPELGNRKSNEDERDAIHLGGVLVQRPSALQGLLSPTGAVA